MPKPSVSPLTLDFTAPADAPVDPPSDRPAILRASTPPSREPEFGDEPELPPTWSEDSRIFHTTEKCTRLQAIRRNRRVTGNPGLRDHCLNCLDIVSTKRRG